MDSERDRKSLKRMDSERSTEWITKAIVHPDRKSLKRVLTLPERVKI